MTDYWRSYSIEELADEIKRNPLTEETVIYFLKNNVTSIGFYPFRGANIIPITDDKVNIGIGLQYPEEERKIALIHEIGHGLYRAGTAENKRIQTEEQFNLFESLIEKEAQRFYTEHKAFVEKIHSQCLENYREKNPTKI